MFQGNDAGNLGFDPFIAQYRAVYDTFTTPPSESVALAQNTMVTTLVDGGQWAKKDQFLLLAQESNGDGEALKNWITPGTNDAVIVNAPAFVSLEGFTPNGTTSYIDTKWNPTDDGSNYTQNAASWGLYCRTNVAEIDEDLGTVAAGNWVYAVLRYAGLNRFYAGTNDGGGTNFAGTFTDSRGFWISNRTAVDANKYYRNKVEIYDANKTTNGLPSTDFFIGAYNSAGNPIFGTTKQYACYFTGGTLTTDDITAITDAVEIYMDFSGKGVIT